MLATGGMSATLAIKLIDRTHDSQIRQLADTAQHKRAIEAFRSKIADVRTVDDLVSDYETYSFVMKAFDLESQIFGKGLIRKMLSGDPLDKTALVNRLTDSRFRELFEAMGFSDGGSTTQNTLSPVWQEKMVDRYLEQTFINRQSDQNLPVGTVLEFRQKAGQITTWFSVLKDPELTEFMRTALGLPDNLSGLDVDKQAALLQKRFDIARLQDPAEQDKLVRRYLALSDARTAVANSASNPLLQLMGGLGRGEFVPVTIDITAIGRLKSFPYR